MVLEHIPKYASFVIITRSMADINAFCNCDLHVIDVLAIPDRLKNCIRKAEKEDILSCFLAQVMVNSVYLIF